MFKRLADYLRRKKNAKHLRVENETWGNATRVLRKYPDIDLRRVRNSGKVRFVRLNDHAGKGARYRYCITPDLDAYAESLYAGKEPLLTPFTEHRRIVIDGDKTKTV